MALRGFNLAVKDKMVFILCWRMLDKKNHKFNSIFPVQVKIIFHWCSSGTKDDSDFRGRSQATLTSFWLFLTTYPPTLTFCIVWTLTKSWHFKTTYLPRLVNVVCERPLSKCNTFYATAENQHYFMYVDKLV